MNDIQSIMGSFVGSAIFGRWIPHNCPCCIHNGQPRNDTKRRAGQLHNPDGSFAFSCFNCGFKTFWKPGFDCHKKLMDLAEWYGATTQQKMHMALIADEIKKSGEYDDTQGPSSYVSTTITPRALPQKAKSFSEWASMPNPPADFLKVLQKVAIRNISLLDTFDLYWTPETEMNLNDRFIIPFYMHGQIVGYTARITWKNSKMRYYNQYPENILYNFDLLNNNEIKDIYVTEGPIDAELIGGVATCHYTIKHNQLDWLTQCGKNIIVVPDRDKDGRKMVEQAIQAGFSVAFPDWGMFEDENGEKCRIHDIDEAVRKYGRLYTMYLIKQATYTSKFEIRVRANNWF